jgi:hypothetical protein
MDGCNCLNMASLLDCGKLPDDVQDRDGITL